MFLFRGEIATLNIFQSLAKLRKIGAALLLACSLFLLPSSLLAGETGTIVAPGGGVITYTNAAAVGWIGGGGGGEISFIDGIMV